MTGDLFGNPVIPEGPAMHPAERRRQKRRASEQARGYAAPPGTGPEGESCRSCAHSSLAGYRYNHGNYWKCGQVQHLWTHSVRTDIRLKSPACRRWEAKNE